MSCSDTVEDYFWKGLIRGVDDSEIIWGIVRDLVAYRGLCDNIEALDAALHILMRLYRNFMSEQVISNYIFLAYIVEAIDYLVKLYDSTTYSEISRSVVKRLETLYNTPIGKYVVMPVG
jgi:hypothetical protein